MRYVRSMPELFVPLVMMAIIGTFAFNFQTVMPLLIKRTLHGNDRTFTMIYSFISVGSLVGALLSARRTSVTVRHIILSAFGFGIAMLLLAVTPSVPFTYPIGMIVGISSITFMTTSTAIMQLRARSLDAGSGPGPAGDRLPGQHADRRADPRLGVVRTSGRACGVAIGGVSAIVAGRLRPAGGVVADPVQRAAAPTAGSVAACPSGASLSIRCQADRSVSGRRLTRWSTRSPHRSSIPATTSPTGGSCSGGSRRSSSPRRSTSRQRSSAGSPAPPRPPPTIPTSICGTPAACTSP